MIDLNLIKKYKLKPPFFIYKKSVIEKQFLKLRKFLPKNFEIFYSVKSNPNIHVLKIFKNLGAKAEISSGGELKTVLKAGFCSNDVIFTGPGKTNEELESTLKNKIRLIIVESLNEIERIEKIAKKLKVKQNLLLRINPSFCIDQSQTMLFRLSGRGQKFGVDEPYIPEIINKFKKLKNVNLVGLHFFSASNIFDEKLIIRNTEYLFKIVQNLESKFSINFPVVDVGGGLGIGYSSDPKEINLKKLSLGFSKLVKKYGFDDKKFILETGRFLVGESGEYVARVIDNKTSYGEKFVIIDGGKNHLSLAALLEKGHCVEVLNKKRSNKKDLVNLVGNLNTSHDYISKTKLPKDIRIGDLVSIKNTGAYSFSVGWMFFSSRPIPGEYLLIKKGRLKNISKKIKIDESR